MPAYTTIPNALVAVGAKPFATTVQAFRDNPIAIAEGDAAAPVSAFAWHPFNKVTNNDANTGRIWSFAVDGAVSLITSPDFVDGYDYAFLFDRVVGPATSQTINLNWFRETSGAYSGNSSTGQMTGGSTAAVTVMLELLNVRLARRSHWINSVGTSHSLVDTVNTQTVTHATAQKILRVQISIPSGSFGGTGAAIYMLRKRNVLT